MASNRLLTDEAERRILLLFENAGTVETPTPHIRAWVARDPASQQPALIKRIRIAAKGRATEALALHHAGVVRTRRWLVAANQLYVVRDIVRGRNLRAALPPERRSAATVQAALLPALQALEWAHAQGVAHGGISAENILVTDEQQVMLSDWATADPKAPQHFVHYNGTASVGGDIRAFAQLLREFLPTDGPFARPLVRQRIEGIIGRCDTLSDLRDTLEALDKLAAEFAPSEKTKKKNPEEDFRPINVPRSPPEPVGVPRLICALTEKVVRIAQGGGGAATLTVKNGGDGPLIVRMIATQHAWLNIRPLELPLMIEPGAEVPVVFHVSAARLTPGEYRSEVYFSTNATGKAAEDLRGGWFKHTAEVRVTVEASGAFLPGGKAAPAIIPPYPAHAAKVPASRSGCLFALPLAPVRWAWHVVREKSA